MRRSLIAAIFVAALVAGPPLAAQSVLPMETAEDCLAGTLYHEARAESEDGMRAVGAVVMNRVASPDYPNDVCSVVKEGGETGSCQFSWWCDGRADTAREEESYEAARSLAREILAGAPDPTNGATNFHGLQGEPPGWASAFTRTTAVGGHIFYRDDG